MLVAIGCPGRVDLQVEGFGVRRKEWVSHVGLEKALQYPLTPFPGPSPAAKLLLGDTTGSRAAPASLIPRTARICCMEMSR